jgi:hypothetical protein
MNENVITMVISTPLVCAIVGHNVIAVTTNNKCMYVMRTRGRSMVETIVI